jgi:hypothetical protein
LLLHPGSLFLGIFYWYKLAGHYHFRFVATVFALADFHHLPFLRHGSLLSARKAVCLVFGIIVSGMGEINVNMPNTAGVNCSRPRAVILLVHEFCCQDFEYSFVFFELFVV